MNNAFHKPQGLHRDQSGRDTIIPATRAIVKKTVKKQIFFHLVRKIS